MDLFKPKKKKIKPIPEPQEVQPRLPEKQVAQNNLAHLAEITNFANTSLSPAHIQEKIDHEVTKRLHRKKSDRMVQLLALALFAAVLIGGIIAIIHYRQCPNCTALCNTGQVAANTLAV